MGARAGLLASERGVGGLGGWGMGLGVGGGRGGGGFHHGARVAGLQNNLGQNTLQKIQALPIAFS